MTPIALHNSRNEQVSQSPGQTHFLVLLIVLSESKGDQKGRGQAYLSLRRPLIVDNAILGPAEATSSHIAIATRRARHAAADASTTEVDFLLLMLLRWGETRKKSVCVRVNEPCWVGEVDVMG